MSTNDPQSIDRYHLFLERGDVQSADIEKERVVREFESALRDVTDSHDLSQEGFRCITGHVYSQIEIRCPNCSDFIELRHPELRENAAYARASCSSCNWCGIAVYRAIDLMQYDEDRESGLFDMIPYHSAVRANDLEPRYYPYK